MMQRVFLLLQAMILLAFGLAYLLRPHEMANLSGMLLMQAAAISDVRAYYGALQMGLAAYLVLALTQHLARAALLLLLVLYSALVLGRLAGLWLDGGLQQTFDLYALLFELVSAGLAGYLLRRGA